MDELVKRLRERSVFLFPHHGESRSYDADLMHEAADAIEELSEDNAALNGTVANLLERIADLGKTSRWIPVTERLPEQKINQNTLDFEYVLCATIFGDVRPYKFGRRIGQGEPHFWNGAGYVDTYVTHWMPLPEPPKEET